MTLLNKILLGAGAGIVLVIAGAFMWLLLSNAHLKTKLAQAEGRAQSCLVANTTFAASVVQQNKAVEAMKAAADLRVQAAQAQAATQQQAARAFTKAAATLAKRRKHGDACQAAEALINDYLENAK